MFGIEILNTNNKNWILVATVYCEAERDCLVSYFEKAGYTVRHLPYGGCGQCIQD